MPRTTTKGDKGAPTLTLDARDRSGTTAARALRHAGKVPGVVYGHGAATPIAVDLKQLAELVAGGNRSRVVDASIAGTTGAVIIRKIDTDPLTRRPLSVDFQRVQKGESVYATVTVVIKGISRGVRDSAGIMDVVTHALDVRGPAQTIPEHLEVDVSELGLHEHLTAGQIALPSGFTLVSPAETVVVSIETHRGSGGAGPEETAPTEAPAG